MPSNQRQIIEQGKFTYSPLGKAFDKQTEKQIGSLRSLDLFNEKAELKKIEGIFSQSLINNLICAKLNKIVNWQDIIKKDIVNYKLKRGKTYNFWKYSLPIVFLRNIQEGYLSLEDADNKQGNFDNKLNNFDKSIKNLF